MQSVSPARAHVKPRPPAQQESKQGADQYHPVSEEMVVEIDYVTGDITAPLDGKPAIIVHVGNGARWEEIGPLIQQELADQGIPVTVYNLPA